MAGSSLLDDEFGDLLDDLDLEADDEAPGDRTFFDGSTEPPPDYGHGHGGAAAVGMQTRESQNDLLTELSDDELEAATDTPAAGGRSQQGGAEPRDSILDGLDALADMSDSSVSSVKKLKDNLSSPLISSRYADEEPSFSLPEMPTFGEDASKDDFIDEMFLEEEKVDEGEMLRVEAAIDSGVMKMLHPDFRHANPTEKISELRKDPVLRDWVANMLEERIIEVADAMAVLTKQHIYDCKLLNAWDEVSKLKRFELSRVDDLFSITKIPRKYFTEKAKKGDAKEEEDEDYMEDPDYDAQPGLLEEDSVLPFSALGKMGGKIGGLGLGVASSGIGALGKIGAGAAGITGLKQKESKEVAIVCAGCGNACRFRRKNRHKDNYVAYRCEATARDYMFHDKACVNLRVIKEAVRKFVYQFTSRVSLLSRTGSKNEANFVSIDKDVNMHRNAHERPPIFTTPISDAADYEKPIPDVSGTGAVVHGGGDEDVDEEKEHFDFQLKGDGRVPFPYFRRYRCHVTKILGRMKLKQVFEEESSSRELVERGTMATYDDRFGKLPKELLYCDMNEYGIPIFEFASDALKSKNRPELWIVLQFVALELGTLQVLEVLQQPRHTHLLSKHMLDEYDVMAKGVIEGSRFPIAASLRLAAFMFERAAVDLSNEKDFKDKADAYLDIAKRMLKEIESDHLFAMLLQLPTDINKLSIMDIALKHNLIGFLEDPRVERVFQSVWSGGLDILKPQYTLQDLDHSLGRFYSILLHEPGRFYFCARGKFYTASFLYAMYLALFSWITYWLIFNYTPEQSPAELLLWVCSFGYVTNEAIEFQSDPGAYFATVTNYWDILISICWAVLFVLRFCIDNDEYLKYDANGELDEERTRNQLTSEVYMAAWSALCVLLWSRVVSMLQISRDTGPLIRMIMKMFTDIVNFGLICMLFLIGFTFATYYIIAGDLSEEDDVELGTLTSVSLFIFQTLLGQQDWEKLDSVDGKFDSQRSNMVLFFILLFSVIGSILLLNLLIAMMASTYEKVQEKANSELNKQRIEKTFELDRSRNVIPPPLNVIAFVVYGYWVSFEAMSWVLTFGHKQFNEEHMCPINKSTTQYSVGDLVFFTKTTRNEAAKTEEIEELHGVVCKRKTVAERLEARLLLKGSDEETRAELPPMFDCMLFDIGTGKRHPVCDSEITKVQKPLFKTRNDRIPTTDRNSIYCRYCRWNLTNGDRMSMDYYLELFRERGDHIDPEDQDYMRELLADSDEFGLAYVKLSELCPNCYRPFVVDANGKPDAEKKIMFMLEIVSYLVFVAIVWLMLVVALFLPANISNLIWYLSKVGSMGSTTSGEDKVRKLAMFRTETNDAYRNKVRERSEEEEVQEQVVKRIDRSVDKLQKTLLGKPGEMAAADLDHDDFELKIHDMRAEIDRRFNEMKEMLEEIMKKRKRKGRK